MFSRVFRVSPIITHSHLDVTFKEDANQTADKDAALNLNIITKLAHNALKLLDVGRKNVSIKAKRFIQLTNSIKIGIIPLTSIFIHVVSKGGICMM